jgi:hypothetical protein
LGRAMRALATHFPVPGFSRGLVTECT